MKEVYQIHPAHRMLDWMKNIAFTALGLVILFLLIVWYNAPA